MTIRALLNLFEARGYSVALRLERDGKGFFLSIKAGRPDGAYPRWEKRFPTGTCYDEAADQVASSLVTDFTATHYLAARGRSIEGLAALPKLARPSRARVSARMAS